ncbi:MAG TPA: hypothetical protein VL793_02470 [Patescibacteria group bacterium]|nr:hypothetical protein [Patescibacteria group bacterium]
MDNIKLLLAHSDRRTSNQIEVAVLDFCYDRAAVKSTRTPRLDEFVHQGGLWDFDIVVVGADNLFRDRTQQCLAAADEVAEAVAAIRVHNSSPIIAYTCSNETCEALLQAGADSVLNYPFDADQLKRELRSLLSWTAVEAPSSNRWSSFGSILRGLQKA